MNMNRSKEDTTVQDFELMGGDAGKLINGIINGLQRNAKVLFVGCQYALPIMDCIASADHQVHGIDNSQEFIDSTAGEYQMQIDWTPDITCYNPGTTYDAIFAIHSLYGLSPARMRAMTFRMSDWLHKDCSLLVATTLPDNLGPRPKPHEELVRTQSFLFNGKSIASMLYTWNGWNKQCARAGLRLDGEAEISLESGTPDRSENHFVMTFSKTVEHAIVGPFPLPDQYRGPIALSEAAWKPFAERLVRDEFDFVLSLLEANRKVLDVGSGYGKLPIELAERKGVAYSIEPNVDRNSIQVSKAADRGVQIAAGVAEEIPFPDAFFDACVAMWVLHYVSDLERALLEMVRVTDVTDLNARIIIVQGAPENEVIDLMNTFCAPVSDSNRRPNHQGYLLHIAARVFTKCGFGRISFHRVDAYCEFNEESIDIRCKQAAEIIAGLWCLEDKNFHGMKEGLLPHLENSFRERPHAIGDQVAILVARPSI